MFNLILKNISQQVCPHSWWFYHFSLKSINALLFTVTSFLLFKSYLQLDKDLALILSLENAGGRWTLVALEIKWKVTECSFCPKKAALDMECHRQLFLPHHRTCYKDSPTWVEIMPPIPAPKHTLSCSIVQRGRTRKKCRDGAAYQVVLSKDMWNTVTTYFCMMYRHVSLSWLDQQ